MIGLCGPPCQSPSPPASSHRRAPASRAAVTPPCWAAVPAQGRSGRDWRRGWLQHAQCGRSPTATWAPGTCVLWKRRTTVSVVAHCRRLGTYSPCNHGGQQLMPCGLIKLPCTLDWLPSTTSSLRSPVPRSIPALREKEIKAHHHRGTPCGPPGCSVHCLEFCSSPRRFLVDAAEVTAAIAKGPQYQQAGHKTGVVLEAKRWAPTHQS